MGFNAHCAALSPGIVLMLLLVEDLFTHDPPRLIDFGSGDHEYKRSLGNSRCTELDVVYLAKRRAIYPHLVFGAVSGLNWLKDRGTSLLRRLRLDRSMRRTLRKQ
jgi:CelD/BcsL family acetyltransferase involved in cellulose biosynthesis